MTEGGAALPDKVQGDEDTLKFVIKYEPANMI